MSDSERLLLIILTALACPLALPFLPIIEKGDQHMNTNKPLSEWTLGEVKAECEKHTAHCVGCLLWTDAAGCRLDTSCYRDNDPKRWDLSEPPRWTEQDREDAKALKRLIPGAHHVWRCSTSSSLQLYDKYNNYILPLNNCFATLPLRESVMLDEIIGGTNE